jgi:hypothetical protein
MTIRLMAKICSVAVMLLLVIIVLGPAKWQPRTGLGWQIDHFVGYFAITSLVCFAWPRHSWSGEPSWPAGRCWSAYNILHRIAALILRLPSGARLGR